MTVAELMRALERADPEASVRMYLTSPAHGYLVYTAESTRSQTSHDICGNTRKEFVLLARM